MSSRYEPFSFLNTATIFWSSGRCWARSVAPAFSSAALTDATSRWIGGLASSESYF